LPTDTFQAEVDLGVGNFDEQKYAASISGPITDSIRYRVAGWYEDRDGVDRNLGINEKEGYAFHQNYLEAQLDGNIGEKFKWWFKTADINYNYAGPPGGRVATFSTAPYVAFQPSLVAPATQYQRTGFIGGLAPLGTYAFSGDPSIIS